MLPLLPKGSGLSPAERLNPVFSVEGEAVLMATQFMAAMPEGELRVGVGGLAGQQQVISDALDMLFLGF